MANAIEIILVATFCALSCSVLGIFWMLERNAYVSDAISHSVLLGVVGVFLLGFDPFGSLGSLGGALSALLCVILLTQTLSKKAIKEDAVVTLVIGIFFSLAVVLISRYASGVHLDMDSILLGELIFSILDRVQVAGMDMGPKAVYKNFFIFFVNGLFVLLAFKGLRMEAFDYAYAQQLRTRQLVLKGTKVVLSAITAIVALDTVGVVLTVSFFVVPGAAVHLFSVRSLGSYFLPMALFVVGTIPLGYAFSFALDVSVAGSLAFACLVGFFSLFLLRLGLVKFSLRR